MVGKSGNAAVDARGKARERLRKLNADRAARDARIEEATAAVIDAADRHADAARAADAERETAQKALQVELARIEKSQAAAQRRTEPAMAAGLAALASEKVSPADMATLTGLSPADVRRLRGTQTSGVEPATEPAASEPAGGGPNSPSAGASGADTPAPLAAAS